MKHVNSTEAALHLMVLLAAANQGLSAVRLAEAHDLSALSVAKLLQDLARAGLIASIAGRGGGYRLARPAEEIHVLEVVDATGSGGPAFYCREIRRRGACGSPHAAYSPRCSIARVMDRAEAAWRDVLASVSLADLMRDLQANIAPSVAAKAAAWLQAAAR